MGTATFIALLRGINVSGRNKIPMPELRALCEGLDWGAVQTYIQSGNLLFHADAAPEALEAELERAITGRFGLTIPVIVRAAAAWPDYVANNPFPEASEREPNLVMLALAKAEPKADAVERLRERATSGEHIERAGDAIWVHYPQGAGTSKLSPALFDRLVGSPVTARNWRTVLKISELSSPKL
jgi:uncharacterized protein (DUF1697 family)